jgi:hypothetical protein
MNWSWPILLLRPQFVSGYGPTTETSTSTDYVWSDFETRCLQNKRNVCFIIFDIQVLRGMQTKNSSQNAQYEETQSLSPQTILEPSTFLCSRHRVKTAGAQSISSTYISCQCLE